MTARRRIDHDLLRALYIDQNMITMELCKYFQATGKTIGRELREAGIAPKRTGPRPGHSKKPAERTIDTFGYCWVLKPNHPQANPRGYVREHRLVMEQKLGRLLLSTEDVHHKDGNKQNNDPENLEVFPSRGDHIRHHNLEDSTAKQLKNLSDEEIRTLYLQKTTVQIAEEFGTSPASVQRELNRRGIRLRSGPRNWPAGYRDSILPQQKPNGRQRQERDASSS